ncbi:MAG: DUF4330 domain-containing protein [Clostridia bacterium]|nr:DUF4330 domain-containing protein [Clostridia bacterium]
MSENKIKFNIIDFSIVLFILAALIFGGMHFLSPKVNKVNTKTIEYTVLLAEKSNFFADALKIGETVTISTESKDKATIIDVKESPAKILTFDSINGKYRYEENENKSDVLVTLKGTGTETDTMIKIGNTPIKVGKSVAIKSSSYSAKGYIVDLNVK